MFRFSCIFFCVVGLLYLSCTFEKPQAPTWDTNLSIPLSEQTLTMADVVRDYSEIFADENGLLGISITGAIDTTRIVDLLELPDFSAQTELALADLHFPKLPIGSFAYGIADIYPVAANFYQQRVPIPSHTFTDVRCSSPGDDYFKYIKIEQGTIKMYIRNNLPVPLRNVVLTFNDPTNPSSQIVSPVLPLVDAQQLQILYIKIYNKPISNNGYWSISGQTPGSSGKAVLITESQNIVIESELANFSASSVNSKMPSVEIQDERSIEMQSEYWVEELGFRQGELHLQYTNSLDVGVQMNLQLDCFTHKLTNEPLVVPIGVQAHESHVKDVALQNYVLSLPTTGSTVLQTLPVRVTAITEDAENRFVNLAQSNGFRFEFSLQNVQVDFITGQFPEQTYTLPNYAQDIHLPEEFTNIVDLNMHDAFLQLHIFNRLSIPFTFTGSLVGIAEDGRSRSTFIYENISAATGILEKENVLPTLTAANSTIDELMNLPPQKILVDGTVDLQSATNSCTIRWDDYVRAEYQFATPAQLSWSKTAIDVQTDSIAILPSHIHELANFSGRQIGADEAHRIQAFTVIADVENHLPANGALQLAFATDKSRLNNHPDLLIDDLVIEPANINADGVVSELHQQHIALEFTNEDVQLFHNDSDSVKIIYLCSQFILDGTNGKQVKFFDSDYLKISAGVQMSFTIENE